MYTSLLFCGALSFALLTPLAYGSTVSFNVSGSGAFQGQGTNGKIDGLTFPSGNGYQSFAAPFSSNYTSNTNVTAVPTFYGAPGVAIAQSNALGAFTFFDSSSSASNVTGPIDLNMNVTIGSSTTTLTFVGSLVASVSNGTPVLDINYTPQVGQFVQTFFDPTYNVSGTYVMQTLNGYEFGILESTLAESSQIDSKMVAIDGVVITTAVASLPEPGTLFSFGLTGIGLCLLGLKGRSQKKS